MADGRTLVRLLGWLQDWTDGRVIASCDAALAEALALAAQGSTEARALLNGLTDGFRDVALGVDPALDVLNPITLTSLVRGFGADWRIWASDKAALKAGEDAAAAPHSSCARQILACWIRLVDMQAGSPRMASEAAQAVLRCEAALARIIALGESRFAAAEASARPAQEAGLR
jgi:hypothetical protein